MINGGLLALLTRFKHSVFNEGGGLWFRLHFYSSKHGKQGINIKYDAHTHDQCCKVMFMVALCCQFHLKDVHCKVICKITPNLNFKRVHMDICHCSPNLIWSNMKTKSIF